MNRYEMRNGEIWDLKKNRPVPTGLNGKICFPHEYESRLAESVRIANESECKMECK